MKKHSKQRDAVYAALCSVRTHPCAAEVYDMVREEIPNISLATVYRNLSDLVGRGKALAITTKSGGMRYDGFANEHSHLYCTDCGGVFDIDLPVKFDSTDTDYQVDSCQVVFYGKCAGCKQ